MTRSEALDIVGMLKCWAALDDIKAQEERMRLIKAATEKLLSTDDD